MMINGKGYVCKSCKRELMSDDVTMYGAEAKTISTNCCHARVVKKRENFFRKIWSQLCGR